MSERHCVKFGNIAQQITTKVNPKDTSLDIYVGLEHLDSGSLQIKRHGTPKDVIGEKLRVCKGDIIFGKRRVYQRKLAIADFDGICSAHAMVLRPKEDVVNKDFFPFFLQSDRFMERALQISVGSLSPTINWKTLAEQESSIPSLPDQRRIATTLWVAEDCIMKGELFLVAAERAKQVLMGELFSKGIGHTEFQETKIGVIPKKWRVGKFTELCQLQRGFDLTEATRKNGDVPVYSSSGVSYNHNEAKVEPPGVVTGRKGIIGKVFFVDKPFWPHDTTLWVTDFKMNDPKYVFWYLTFFKLERFDASTACPTLNRNNLTDIQIPLPPLPEQRQIATFLTRCDETIAAARANVTATKALKMKMINEMLNPGGLNES
jgi:type I restriction enzyme, S subunit